MSKFVGLVFATASLAGCFAESETQHPKPLAEFAKLHLEIRASASVLTVGIGYDENATGCASLSSSFHAAIGDTTIPVVAPGSEGEDDGYSFCNSPRLRLDGPPALAPTELVLGDNSLTVTANLGDALLPRTASLAPGAPWTFMVDQSVEITWSPASDLTTYTPEVWLMHDERVWFFPVTVSNDRLQFTLHSANPEIPIDSSELQIKMEERPLVPLVCENATCGLVTDRTVTKDVVIQSP